MFTNLLRRKIVMVRTVAAILTMLLFNNAQAQERICEIREGNIDTLRNLKFIENVVVSDRATGDMRGLIEYLPPDYDSVGNTREYPVLIFFHGLSGRGDGTYSGVTGGLCRIIRDSWQTVLGLADQQPDADAILPPDFLNNYIIIAPQYLTYNYDSVVVANNNFPTAINVEDAINYVENNYRVNSDAIILTGFSSGANMVMEYMSSSVERANRVKAANVISMCSKLGRYPTASDAHLNVAESDSELWIVACQADATCNYIEHAQTWVDMINSADPVNEPFYTLFPTGSGNCTTGSNHNAWNAIYDPNLTFGPESLSFYDWLDIQAALPVKLKSYDVRMLKDKVLVNWTTSNETNNASFSIERAGDDQQFTVIGTVPGSINSSSDKNYSFTDANPLNGISYYRLVQTDIDGKQTRFEIKRVISSASNGKRLIVSPNPFGENLTAFINLNSQQKVSVYITDMGGRRLITQSAVYSEGSREIRLNTSSLPKGMYFLRIEGENFNEVQKVIRR